MYRETARGPCDGNGERRRVLGLSARCHVRALKRVLSSGSPHSLVLEITPHFTDGKTEAQEPAHGPVADSGTAQTPRFPDSRFSAVDLGGT